MKLAHIVYQFPKLSETFILNQIVGLIDLGCSLSLFAFAPSHDVKVHSLVKKYKLLETVSYFYIPNDRFKRILYFFFLFSRDPFRSFNIFKTLYKYKKNYYFLLNNFFLASYFKKKHDIIHCHYGTLGKRFLFLKNLYPQTKLVVSFHGFDITRVIKEYGEEYYNDLFHKADFFLPISDYWKRRLINLGCPPSKISVLRMGINLDLFSFKIRRPSKLLKFLTVGRLVEKKGIQYAIEAFAKITSQNSDFLFKYFIAGDGPLKSYLMNLIKEKGLEEKVYLLGQVSQDEVQRLMDNSHIFLLPSVTASDGDQEGIPVVLMEAMASGLPVISTYHSGIPELVIDGKTGFLVPEKNVEALAAKILFLAQNLQIWSEISEKARNLVEREYNIKIQVKKLANIYQKLLVRYS